MKGRVKFAWFFLGVMFVLVGGFVLGELQGCIDTVRNDREYTFSDSESGQQVIVTPTDARNGEYEYTVNEEEEITYTIMDLETGERYPIE